jgi:indolepyruvate ferredoxin oxidoreductase beta subunit
MEALDILIAGVGGQGTLLASRILGGFALREGFDCKLSEVHGMAQRGGGVVTHVRMAKKVFSPVVERGGADVVLAFETAEAARAAVYLKKGGKLVVNEQSILPLPVLTGAAAYPYAVLNDLKRAGIDVYAADALKIAREAGDIRALNVVLIGCMTRLLGLNKAAVRLAVEDSVPAKALNVNLKAFEEGYNYDKAVF